MSPFKDPYVFEFVDIPKNQHVLETDLESVLIDSLEEFLLELGRGFSFVKRQRRLSDDGGDWWVDLVFYNFYLRRFVLFDLKTGSSVKLPETSRIIAEPLAPFAGFVLRIEYRGIMEIGAGFQQMVKDLDSVLRIPANAEIINEEDTKPGVVFQLLRIFGHVLPGQAKELVHHIAVVAKLAAIIQAAGLVAKSRSKIGFPGSTIV